MNRLALLVCVAGMLVVAGCGDEASTVPFNQTELDKHVEEHPVPLVTEDDFRAADAMDE
jgi:hypothetical protein